jgi:hypothetical protein
VTDRPGAAHETARVTDSAPAQPLEPLQTNEVAVVLVGMALWLVTLIVLVVGFRHDLSRHQATWWYWTCGLGLVLGLYGLRFALRRRHR